MVAGVVVGAASVLSCVFVVFRKLRRGITIIDGGEE